jgi:hypothetical protein
MKKIVVLATVLMFVAFVAAATAQQKPAPASPSTTVAPAPAPGAGPAPEKSKAEKPKAEKPKAAKAEKMSGTVEKVDEMAKTFVAKDKKGEKTFTVDDKTKITKGGKPAALADLKTGLQVSVTYKMEGDKAIASAVGITAPKAPAKEKKAPEKATEPVAKPPEKPAEAPKK